MGVYRGKTPAEKHYADPENCRRELCEARELFGSRSTTRGAYRNMQFCLGLMLLYAPVELRPTVEATIYEAALREFYYEMNVWPSEDGDEGVEQERGKDDPSKSNQTT